MADTYTQHNPWWFLKMDTYTGAHGWQAWVAANEEATRRGNLRLVDLGGVALRNPMTLDRRRRSRPRGVSGPDSRSRRPSLGQRYDAFAFEAFRFADGKFVEHWDQVQLPADDAWRAPAPPGRSLAADLPGSPAAAGHAGARAGRYRNSCNGGSQQAARRVARAREAPRADARTRHRRAPPRIPRLEAGAAPSGSSGQDVGGVQRPIRDRIRDGRLVEQHLDQSTR